MTIYGSAHFLQIPGGAESVQHRGQSHHVLHGGMHLDEWKLTINAKRRNMKLKAYHRAHTGGSEKVQFTIDIANLVPRLLCWTEKCYYFACGILKLQK